MTNESDPVQDAFVVARRDVGDRFQDLEVVESTDLYDGPRSRKVAKYITIKDRHTGSPHHHALTIETYKKSKGLQLVNEKNSITLDDEKSDQIGRLADFIRGVRATEGIAVASDYLIVPGADAAQLAQVKKAAEALRQPEQAELLLELMERLGGNIDGLRGIVEVAKEHPTAMEGVAAALNFGRFGVVLKQLQELIAANAREQQFQELLTANPWIFGSEYSQLWDSRELVRSMQHDFVFRRTADDFLEIVEIKTPLGGKPLFNFDKSHKSYYPCSDLSLVIGQTMGYLEEIDANIAMILRRDGVRVEKIRAKIVIGRDVNEEQRKALRRLNGHLHRIEVLTFDQLTLIGTNVQQALKAAAHGHVNKQAAEIPF